MTGSVEAYQDALAEYEQAEKAARDMVHLINKVRECFYPAAFPSFVGWSFGISDQVEPGRKYDPKAKVDLEAWPDADEMKARFQAWHSALKKLHAAWTALPEERRRGFQSPPRNLDTRGWS